MPRLPLKRHYAMVSILTKDKTGYAQSRVGEDQWNCEVSKGELIVPIPKEERRQIEGVTSNYRLYRDPQVVLYADPVHVSPLDEKEVEYLQAVSPPSVRLKEYFNNVVCENKMNLVVGDTVLFKLEIGPRTPTAQVNGTIRHIGRHPDSDGIIFGIEIQVSLTYFVVTFSCISF